MLDNLDALLDGRKGKKNFNAIPFEVYQPELFGIHFSADLPTVAIYY